MSTSVHFPADLAEKLTEEAARRGVSRNRLVVDACRAFLEMSRDRWPDALFQPLPDEERREMKLATADLEAAVSRSRRSKTRPPF